MLATPTAAAPARSDLQSEPPEGGLRTEFGFVLPRG